LYSLPQQIDAKNGLDLELEEDRVRANELISFGEPGSIQLMGVYQHLLAK